MIEQSERTDAASVYCKKSNSSFSWSQSQTVPVGILGTQIMQN
jgi:hypothetical protein